MSLWGAGTLECTQGSSECIDSALFHSSWVQTLVPSLSFLPLFFSSLVLCLSLTWGNIFVNVFTQTWNQLTIFLNHCSLDRTWIEAAQMGYSPWNLIFFFFFNEWPQEVSVCLCFCGVSWQHPTPACPCYCLTALPHWKKNTLHYCICQHNFADRTLI